MIILHKNIHSYSTCVYTPAIFIQMLKPPKMILLYTFASYTVAIHADIIVLLNANTNVAKNN